MSSISADILATVHAELAVRQARTALDEVKSKALARPSAMDGVRALRGEGIAVIGELAASGPSMGALAGEYEEGGANAVSVPIGPGRSGGTLQDLATVRAQVQVPILCKDIVVSGYQLWEARAHGADLVLLIAEVLTQDALVSLVERAESIGMHALVEVRDERELLRALAAGARIVAANPRDRDGLEVDRPALARLVPLIPEGVVRVAECGSSGRLDLIGCAKAGADAVLLRPSSLAGRNPRETVAGLVSVGAHPALSRGRRQAV